MPKIYEYLGYDFFFYSNEHEPVHVHVKKGSSLMKFELLMNYNTLTINCLKYKKYDLFNATERNEIESFIERKHVEIRSKWDDFFVLEKNLNLK